MAYAGKRTKKGKYVRSRTGRVYWKANKPKKRKRRKSRR
jgi:hypothetical protein